MGTNVGRKELELRKGEYERHKNVPIGMQLGVARETGHVAENTTVHIRVAEAKNLPAKDISGTSDPFCVLRVDNQEVARTATVWKDLSPFWGEDFTLHIPRGFHNISLYVYDEDLVGQDDVIGKLSLDHGTLTKSVKGVDGWFPLQPISKDEEVQGDLEVEFKLSNVDGQNVLTVHILQARGLAAKDTSGTSDPFVKFHFRGQTYRTEVVKKTLFPKWYQSFEIPLGNEPLTAKEMLDLIVWDWDRMSHNDFLGQARICIGNLVQGVPRTAWYRLVARKHASPSLKRKSAEVGSELGSLRVMMLVREDTILPSQFYKPLLELMVKSVLPPWTEYANVVSMFEEVAVADKTEMATIMIKLYLGQGKVVDLLDFLNKRDLDISEKATLFRGNSFATKANDQFMKVVATKYLQQVLKPVIDMIYEEKKYCEIDPTKIETAGRQSTESMIEANVATVASYILRAIKSIFASVRQCPPVMRLAFKRLRKRVDEKFPPDQEANKGVCYLAMSGFIFLRFFAPAILSPKLFFLKDSHPDKKTSRTLTLVAKAIQNIGNLGGQLSSAKEMFMKPLHPLILDNVPQVKVFLDQLVDISDRLDDHNISGYNTSAPVVIKEGHLMKKKGSSLALDVVGSIAMQRRYFWLSRYSLMYAKSPDSSDKDRHTLSLQYMLAVEPVDPAAFQTANTFQVVYQSTQNKIEIYYFVAKDVNEQQQWISSLRKVCLQNHNMLPTYHPGAQRHGKWTCCQNLEKSANGCSRSHGGVILGDHEDPLDPEAEAQTVYSQLWNGFETLRKKYCADRPFPSMTTTSTGAPYEPGNDIAISVPAAAAAAAKIQGPATGIVPQKGGEQRRVSGALTQVASNSSEKTRLQLALREPSSYQQAMGHSVLGDDADNNMDKSSSDSPAADSVHCGKVQYFNGGDSGGDGRRPSAQTSTSSMPLCEVPEVDEDDAMAKEHSPPPGSSGAETPTKKRKRSLRSVLSLPFPNSPGSSPKLLRSKSATNHDKSASSSTRRQALAPEDCSSPSKSPVVRLRSLGSVVRDVELPPGMSIDGGDSVNGMPHGQNVQHLQRHQTAPELHTFSDSAMTPGSSSGDGHLRKGLRPHFSNLSINSQDSVVSPSATGVTPFDPAQHSLPGYVAEFVNRDGVVAGQDSLPLRQPIRAMSEMLLDELERLHEVHVTFEAMPRRTSVVESA